MKQKQILLSATLILMSFCMFTSCSDSDDDDSEQKDTVVLNTDANLLQGAYTVNASGKKVQFTKGNLYCQRGFFSVTWGLEDSQTVIYSNTDDYDTDHVVHFKWTVDMKKSYLDEYKVDSMWEDDIFWCDGSDEDHMITVNGTSNLYLLSQPEWEYLFTKRDSRLSKKNVTIDGVKGYIVLAPDNYTGTIAETYSKSDWATAEAHGFVCLAPAGTRSFEYINEEGQECFYWTSTPDPKNNDAAYYVHYDIEKDGNVDTACLEYGRWVSMSLRLVKTIQSQDSQAE